MAEERLEQALRSVDRKKRAFVKQLVIGTAFAVPAVASYSVRDLAIAQVGSQPGTTVCSTIFFTTIIETTTFTLTTTTCFTTS